MESIDLLVIQSVQALSSLPHAFPDIPSGRCVLLDSCGADSKIPFVTVDDPFAKLGG
jgi:hypothetical protein